MAYTKVNWAAGVTPLSEGNMDHLETQYDELIALFNAHTILMAVADNDPAPLTMGASTILARLAAGNIVAATPTQLMALLSGSAGAEFLLNTQKIGGVVDPTTDQQVATKKYVDDNITKEFWIPLGYSNPTLSNQGDFQMVLMVANSFVYFNFKVPADFTSLTHVKVVGISASGIAVDWTVTTDFAAIGEVYTTNSDSDTANAVGTTINEIEEMDISAAFTGLVAGDIAGVKFVTDNACNYELLGLIFKYS